MLGLELLYLFHLFLGFPFLISEDVPEQYIGHVKHLFIIVVGVFYYSADIAEPSDCSI